MSFLEIFSISTLYFDMQFTAQLFFFSIFDQIVLRTILALLIVDANSGF